jgi:hypothetical protein
VEKIEHEEPGMFFFGDSNNRYFGQSFKTYDDLAAMMETCTPITFLNVLQVTTVHLPIAPTQQELLEARAKGEPPLQHLQRRTFFTTVDMCPGPLPKMTIQPTYIYPLDQEGPVGEGMKRIVRGELKGAEERDIESRLQRSGLHGV